MNHCTGHRQRCWVLPLVIVFGAAVRLYQVTAPPIDFLSWRCTATLMAARNFYLHDLNLFRPQVDWYSALSPPGSTIIAGTELMVAPYLTALLYFLLGTADWVGRIVPILFSLLGLAYFFRLAERFYGRGPATLGALLAALGAQWLLGKGRFGRLGAVVLVTGAMLHSCTVALQLYAPRYASLMHCGAWIRDHAPAKARVLVSNQSSTILYFAQRQGWTSWPKSYGTRPVFDAEFVNKTGRWGATVLAVPHDWFDSAYQPDYNEVRDVLYDSFACWKGPDFTIFSLTAPADLSLPDGGTVQFGTADARKYLRGTWGPDQAAKDGRPFTTMGPANAAQIRFALAKPAHELVLDIATPVRSQTAAFAVNNAPAGTAELPEPGTPVHVTLQHLPPPDAEGLYTLTLDATQHNADGVILLLYQLTVPPESGKD